MKKLLALIIVFVGVSSGMLFMKSSSNHIAVDVGTQPDVIMANPTTV